MAKRKGHLRKSRENKKISGVFGGLGEQFDVDPTILRLIWVVVTLFTGLFPGLIAYLIAAFIMPSK